jgi:hypothetical protein
MAESYFLPLEDAARAIQKTRCLPLCTQQHLFLIKNIVVMINYDTIPMQTNN